MDFTDRIFIKRDLQTHVIKSDLTFGRFYKSDVCFSLLANLYHSTHSPDLGKHLADRSREIVKIIRK